MPNRYSLLVLLIILLFLPLHPVRAIRASIGDDRLPPVTLSKQDLDGLWKTLADADASRAYWAIIRLGSCPTSTPAFLEKRLEPAKPGEASADVDLSRNPELLRSLRAVEALEYVGTPDAQRTLKKLAGGAAEARLTQDAKESLKRLAKNLDVNRVNGN
jgi:hypothetical protein